MNTDLATIGAAFITLAALGAVCSLLVWVRNEARRAYKAHQEARASLMVTRDKARERGVRI